MKLQQQVSLDNNQSLVGENVKVLVEGTSKRNKEILSGYSEENKLVNFKGSVDSIGKIVNVKTDHSDTSRIKMIGLIWWR